jgi:hypothetical protein
MGHGICGPPAKTKSPTPPKEGGVGHPVQEFIVDRSPGGPPADLEVVE